MSTDLVKQVSEPISADNPAGAQLEEDPDYDKINTEIQKIGAIREETVTVNWGEVVRAGTAILTQKSKDISVAIWLCMGLYQTQGYSGLSVGIEICNNIIDRFWEVLYPPLKRIRGRAAPITWLSMRLTPLVTEKAPKDNEAEAVISCAKNIEKLVELSDAKFGDNSPTKGEKPNLLDLRKIIQAYAVKFKIEEKPAQAEVAVKPSEQQATTTTAAATSPQGATATQPTEFTSPDNAYQWIMRAVTFLRENKPDNPIPYKLSRVIKWYSVVKLPPATNGKTLIPGIVPQLVQAFQSLLNSSEWDKLLKQSETNFSNALFWFDLQRFVDRAMTELGAPYNLARQVVREEMANLVRRLPGILDLQFQNGIPFADGQTKMWIESEVLPSVASTSSESKETNKSGETAPKNDIIIETVAEAKRIAVGGKLEDALSLLNGHLADASLRREQFMWRLNLAKLCLEVEKTKLALPQLESLDEEVRQFSLEQWEPELAVDVLRSLLQCRKKLMQDIKQPSPELTSIISELYSRLCRLDVISALTLDSVP
ncbi:MAG: type VI secretion system protein TssA [Candidatus Poribacteria bacterium]